MIKLKSTIYKKLIAQAEEAKEHGMTKLADSVTEAIESSDVVSKYSFTQLQDDVQKDLWKAASHIIKYYDLDSADIQKINNNIIVLASNIIDELSHTIGADNVVIGPLEDKIPGEDK